MFPFFDPTMIFVLPALIFAFYAQYKVKSTYDKYANVNSRKGFSGAEVAAQILARNNLHVKVEEQSGFLTDHYDPKNKVLRLSSGVFHGRSISALGVAAHEAGHALQDQNKYVMMNIRSSIVPAANIGSTMAFPLFFMGFFFKYGIFMDIGIILFSLAVLFHLVTLPVEFNASKRAMVTLEDNGFLEKQEIESGRKVLNAAALTYVAATAVAAMHLIRLLILRNNRRD
ncbi:MAG: zinc metallopeptidase [bacterium]